MGAKFEGMKAYANKVVVGDNPYDEHDDKHWQWMAGWVAQAQHERKHGQHNTQTSGPGREPIQTRTASA